MSLDDAVSGAVRLHDLAISLHAHGNLAEAAKACQQSLRKLESALPGIHPDIANVLNTLARIRGDQGAFGEAERLSKRSIRMLENVHGDDNNVERIRIQSLCGLAGNYRIQGRYKKADPLYRAGLVLAQKVFGRDTLEVSAVLNDLAVLY